MPEVHRVEAIADVAEAAFLLQFDQCRHALGQRPFGIAARLVCKVVTVDKVEVISAQAARTSFELGSSASAGVIQRVLTAAAAARTVTTKFNGSGPWGA
jgi:hypothetical protein